MKKSKWLLIPVLFFFNAGFTQNIESALQSLASLPTEKIYIHYDKEYYVAGETVWMKAYLFSDGKPSGISTNLYLQLLDHKGQIISDNKYPVMGAIAKGNIRLPDTLAEGNYYIRALTPHMLNFDEAFIYKKNFYVFNPLSRTKSTTTPAKSISLQFFPESGYLVNGIQTVVAFKATDQFGMPVDIEGTIRTEDGTTVAPFISLHDGVGKTQFTPVSGKKYLAEFETAAGKRSVSLPAVQSSGINLKVEDEAGGKMFQLSRSEKDQAQFRLLTLVAEMNNRIVFETEIDFEDYPAVKGHIITDSLPSGILHFTVFNKGLPLAERLSFVNNREYMTEGAIEVVRQGTGKREENHFDIVFPEAFQRSASVSITDASSGYFGTMDNIYARTLLSSDLKGYIHNPGYYFHRVNDSVRQALDNLMLTHGWSRFSWNKILANEFPQKKVVDGQYLYLSGIVKENANKEPYSGGRLNVYTESEDSTTRNYEVAVNPQGRFVIDSMIFYGKTRIFYAYTNDNGKQRPALIFPDYNSLAEMAVKPEPAIISIAGAADPGNEQKKDDLVQRAQFAKAGLDEVKELPNVNVRTVGSKNPLDAVNDRYTSGVFRTPGKENIDNINNPVHDKSMNAVDFVKNRIQQLEIQGGRFVNRKNFSLISGQKWPVQIFINEAPADISYLRTLRADQIALVKFYEAGFVGVGSGAPGGALAVYTKESNEDAPKPEKLNFINYNGYTVTREFYSPDYNSPATKKDLVDRRTTLYWNPDLVTDNETKRIALKFFNNDYSKSFRIIVEGFDAEGKLIRLERTIGNVR